MGAVEVTRHRELLYTMYAMQHSLSSFSSLLICHRRETTVPLAETLPEWINTTSATGAKVWTHFRSCFDDQLPAAILIAFIL